VTTADLKPAQQPRSLQAGTPATRMILLGVVLAIGVVATYYPVHGQPFANYDDADYTFDNMHVRAGLEWSTLRWALTAQDAANWHPVTWISHALDAQLFGMTPAGPHDVNLLFHIVNALLLFWVLQRATGSVGRSWMVAALFALHPLNVESVAWIAERKNVLSMFFLLLTLAAYRWYARKPVAGRYLVVFALFALGLMSKPQVITLPFVLLLWDYWPLERVAIRHSPFAVRQNDTSQASGEKRIANGEWRGLLWEKVPMFALCLISARLTLRAQAGGGATSAYGHVLRLENAVISYARYLGKAVWPSHLALFYPYPTRLYPAWEVASAALLLIVITLAVALAWRRRYLTVGWLWFLGTLVPMIGVVQVGTQAMADRYAYLPFVGLFVMICWLVADVAAQARVPLMLLRVVAACVLVALAVVSHRQVEFWNDHVTLWTHATEVTHDNWVAENNLGAALLKQSRVEDAIPHFRAAVAINPDDPNSNLNIGTYEQMHGNLPAAIERYKAAAELARNIRTKARAYNNLAYAYKEIGDYPDAKQSFQNAVKWDPEYSGAWISLGLLAQKHGDLALAVNAYGHALNIQPSDYGYLLLASALERNGNQQQAQAARRQAALLSDNLISAQHHADELLSK